MRPALLLATLALTCFGAYAQVPSSAKRSNIIVTTDGNSVEKLVGNITDKNVYDEEGNILDSAAAAKLLRTYDYRLNVSRVKGQTGLKKAITRISPEQEQIMLDMSLSRNKPASPKLQIGQTLDLSPFGARINAEKLNGKAIVLIFWSDRGYPNPQRTGYADINYITGKFANPEKFQVLAVTDLDYARAVSAMQKQPIEHANYLYDSRPINRIYQTNDQSLIVITDKDHKITYAAKNWLATTDRFLYKTLEAL